jgi:hypothetical protein
MTGILPCSVSLECKDFGKDSVKFKYTEHFKYKSTKETHDLVERTFALLGEKIGKIGPIKLKKFGKTGLSISGIIPKEVFGNMMTTEFLCWGTVGKKSLADILLSAVMI